MAPANSISSLDPDYILELQQTCKDKHNEEGVAVTRMIFIAAVVAGLFTAYMLGGWMGLLAGAFVYSIGGFWLVEKYDTLRSKEYLHAADMLVDVAFWTYLDTREPGQALDINTVLAVYQRYAAFAATQVRI